MGLLDVRHLAIRQAFEFLFVGALREPSAVLVQKSEQQRRISAKRAPFGQAPVPEKPLRVVKNDAVEAYCVKSSFLVVNFTQRGHLNAKNASKGSIT